MQEKILEELYNEQKNLIVTGDIATGKTTNVIFPIVDKIIKEKESFMILDPKEEYINKYYKILKEKNYNIVVLNLRNPDKSDGWNPLQIAYESYKNGDIDKAMDYLEKIVKTIFYEKTSADPFWSLSASDLFLGVLFALFKDAQKEEINLNSVNMMFEGVNEKIGFSESYLKKYFESIEPTSIAYICAAGTLFAPDATQKSILATARQKLRPYVSREKLSVLMSRTTFQFEDIMKKPTAIFLIAKNENKSLNTLVSMFIEQLFLIIFDLKSINKFNFVLDNFDIIEKVNEFNDMLGAGLARKIKFLVVTRSLEDLVTKYGNYIKRLSNKIDVTNDEIKITINSKKEIIENNYKDKEGISIVQNDVEYPQLEQTTIKIFDLMEYIYERKKDNNYSIDDDELIKKIDDKLKGLNI